MCLAEGKDRCGIHLSNLQCRNQGPDSHWQLPKANPEGIPSGVQQLILLPTNPNFQLNTDLSAFEKGNLFLCGTH